MIQNCRALEHVSYGEVFDLQHSGSCSGSGSRLRLLEHAQLLRDGTERVVLVVIRANELGAAKDVEDLRVLGLLKTEERFRETLGERGVHVLARDPNVIDEGRRREKYADFRWIDVAVGGHLMKNGFV